jgi:hypothetical protein
MKSAAFGFVVIAIALLCDVSCAAAQKQRTGGCPVGKITCEQWCTKYNNLSGNCMTGPGNSCENKPQGAKTCVRDVSGARY